MFIQAVSCPFVIKIHEVVNNWTKCNYKMSKQISETFDKVFDGITDVKLYLLLIPCGPMSLWVHMDLRLLS